MDLFIDYTICEQIGKGSFATVYRAYHKPTKQTVAIKVIDIQKFLEDPTSLRFLQSEVMISQKVNHPLIAQTFEVLNNGKQMGIVMELMEGGSLLDLINRSSPSLSEPEARKYFRQLVYALNYLHSELHVVHRDLKAENILLDKFGNVRLIDFGLSRQSHEMMCTVCGSPAYAAPELIIGMPYTDAVDVWSIGVILYAMLHGCLPFNHENYNKLMKLIVEGDPTFDPRLSTSVIDLLRKMLCKTPQYRITLDQIENHPWFITGNDYNPDALSNPQLFETTLDPQIVSEVERLGLRSRNLALLLDSSEQATEKTAYKILRRKKVTIELEKAFKGLPGHLKKGSLITASLPTLGTLTCPNPPNHQAITSLKSTNDVPRKVGSLPIRSIAVPPMRGLIHDSPLLVQTRRRTRAMTTVGVEEQIYPKLPHLLNKAY